MSEKQSNKERIKEITAGIEKGIMELFESDRYRNYLTTMSRFHKYSLNNVMLIHAQRPNRYAGGWLQQVEEQLWASCQERRKRDSDIGSHPL